MTIQMDELNETTFINQLKYDGVCK